MRVVPRNAALRVAAGLVLVGACGGTVTRSGDTDSAAGTSDPTAGAAGERRSAGAQGMAGSTPGVGASEAQCGSLDFEGLCGVEAAQLATQTVELLLVLDASGSMSGGREALGASLWAGLSDALAAAMTNGSESIHYGLQIFPYAEDPADPIPFECGDVRRCCEMPNHAQMLVPTVEPSVGVPWILEELRAHGPAGAAAVTAALERAHRYFVDGNPPPNGDDRYVLLVTDGAPICNPYAECDVDTCTANVDEIDGCPPAGPSCCNDLPAACLDDAASVEEIDALRSVGVTTIVMGLPGSERYAAVLQRLADAGGFVRANGSTDYYAVGFDAGLDDLVAALDEITTLTRDPCRLAPPFEGFNPYGILLAVDCEIIPQTVARAADEGWYRDGARDPAAIVVTGPVCDRIRWQGVHDVRFLADCYEAPPPE